MLSLKFDSCICWKSGYDSDAALVSETQTRTACCLQFRFVVDGVWKCADDQPAMRDEDGNYINVLEVHEFVPENLESLSGFEPPPSPPSRCFAWPPAFSSRAKHGIALCALCCSKNRAMLCKRKAFGPAFLRFSARSQEVFGMHL